MPLDTGIETTMEATGEKMLASCPYIENEKCVWATLIGHGEKRDYVTQGFKDLMSAMSVLFLICTRSTLNMNRHIFELSFDLFTLFWTASFLRSLVPLIINLSTNLYGKCLISCELGALIESFFTVLEVELLTHVCIERYVVTKYVFKRWNIMHQHYTLYIVLSLFFAFMYTVPVYYMTIAKFSYDFFCDSCTMDMILPDCWRKFCVLAIFFFRSVKPVGFMIMMLYYVGQLEDRPDFTRKMKKLANINYTSLIRYLVFVNLVLWTPLSILRGWVIISQLIFGQILIPSYFTTALRCAMSCYSISSTFATFVVFKADGWLKFSHYNPTDTYRIRDIMAAEIDKDKDLDSSSDHEHFE